MTRLPWDRLIAWVVDWLAILVWVAVVAAVGIPLYLAGITAALPALWLNIVATATVVAPVTVLLAVLESSQTMASLGKRARHLSVVNVHTGSRLSFRRAFARNALKVALPWTIGHAAVYGIVASSEVGPVSVSIWIVTAIAYVLPVAYLVSLFIASGRAPYDRLCGSLVVRVERGRHPAYVPVPVNFGG